MEASGRAAIGEFEIGAYAKAYDLWRRTPGMGLSSADEETAIARFLRENPGLSFAAWDGDRMVGTALCGSDGRRGYLYHLAVDVQFRGRGIGKALVDRCLAALQETGIQKCHLFVIADNATGIAFWEHAGWERRDDIQVFSKGL